MNKYLPKLASVTLALFTFLLLSAGAHAQATLTTDKPDYHPGDLVIITGSGFGASENVILQVLHFDSSGDNDTSEAHQPWDVHADETGSFVAQWTVPLDEDEIGATLTATADGRITGLHAETIFTDAVIQWTNATAATAWYTNTNWTPNTASGAWLTSDIAQFNNTGTATTAGINMGTASLSIGAIEMTSARTRNLTIGNSSATVGTLTLNGTTVNSVSNTILRNASGNLLTLQDNETGSGKTMNIALGNSTDNIVNIDGTGGVTISSIIGGSGKKLSKGGSGTGVLELQAANTYTGQTTVNAGTLRLNKSGGGTLPSTNDVVVNTGGTLKISSNQTLNNVTVASGATLQVDAGVTLTINGTYSVFATTSGNSGTIQINGTLKINQGGWPGNTGTFS
jgi:autotransporter-associated beta strand protein